MIFPIKDDAGKTTNYAKIARDITEGERVEEVLRKSENELRSLFNAMQDIVFEMDYDGRYVYIAPTSPELMYKLPEEVLGKTLHEVFLKTEADRFLEIIRKCLDENRIISTEYPLIIKGRTTWFEGRATPKTKNTVLYMARDISGRKQAEISLKESEERYRRIFEESQDVIFVRSIDGKFLNINPTGLQLFGYSSLKEIQKIDIAKDLYKNPQDKLKYQQRLRENGFIKEYELRLKKKDGTELIFIENSTAIYDKDKNITACRGIMRDMTEKKNLERQLAQAQKLESIGTLAGGVAHDFNNLLTVINGYAEMALMQMDAGNLMHKNIRAILQAGKRAENLTSQLLAFSRKQIYKAEILDINQVLSSIDNILRRLIDEDINIKSVTTDHIPNIIGDKSQLEQIFVNLVVNARDALRAVSKQDFQKNITIETGRILLDNEYVLKHPGSQQGQHIFFSVSDNGIGMDEQTKEKVFEPFFTTKEKYKGTGLGLSMVYGIVKQNKASVYVYSEPGKGTMFKIYWPVTEEHTKAEEKAPGAEILYGSETILVVEDEEEVCRFASESLMSLGYIVYKAANGRLALELIKNESLKFNLIVSDLIMPELNGKEFIKKARVLYPDLKVIYVSGYTDNHIVHNGMLEEGVNFINKPYSVRTLAAAVRKVLDEV